jgi:UDP-glucose 4-epimerase
MEGRVALLGSLQQLCDTLLAAMGSKLQARHVEQPDERKAVDVWRRLADTSKARELLGFEARISLEKSLARLVRWLDAYADAVS